MDDVLLNTEQVAEYLGVDPATVRRYRAMGLPHVTLPGAQTVRYRRSEIHAWLDAHHHGYQLDDLEEVH